MLSISKNEVGENVNSLTKYVNTSSKVVISFEVNRVRRRVAAVVRFCEGLVEARWRDRDSSFFDDMVEWEMSNKGNFFSKNVFVILGSKVEHSIFQATRRHFVKSFVRHLARSHTSQTLSLSTFDLLN